MDDLGAQGWPVAWSAAGEASGREADGGFDIRGMSKESGLTEDGQINWPAWNASMRQSTLALASSCPAGVTVIVRLCTLTCKLLHQYIFYLGSPKWREAMQFDMLGGAPEKYPVLELYKRSCTQLFFLRSKALLGRPREGCALWDALHERDRTPKTAVLSFRLISRSCGAVHMELHMVLGRQPFRTSATLEGDCELECIALQDESHCFHETYAAGHLQQYQGPLLWGLEQWFEKE